MMNLCNVQDMIGNIIHKTTVNPEMLVEGFRMYIENKEIEVKLNLYTLIIRVHKLCQKIDTNIFVDN